MVKLETFALHVDEVFRPQAADRDQAFLEACAKPAARHAKRLELNVAVADPGAKHELAARQKVKRRQLLGEIERLVQRDQHQPADFRSRGATAVQWARNGICCTDSNGCAL